MDISMESVGERIKNRRKELQLTQTDIFDMCGIRSGALSRIENGTSVPSVILFYKISQVLKCDMNWLLTGVSSNMENSVLSIFEEELITSLRQLNENDQDEIMDILQVKLNRAKRKKEQSAKSSSTTGSEGDILVG